MDPASIISLTAGLVTLCVRVGKGLHDVHSSWTGASLTVAAISSETAVIAAALQQIENLARKDPEGLSSRLDEGSRQLATSFELSLGGCEFTLNVLNEHVTRLTASSKSIKFLSFRSKTKYMWNEAEMKDLLQNVRGQQSALNLLLNACQTESISDVRRILNDNNVILSKMVNQSQALKSIRAASTIGGKDVEFDFDDQIISSSAYRRAFNSFVNRPLQEDSVQGGVSDKETSYSESTLAPTYVRRDSPEPRYLPIQQPVEQSFKTTPEESTPKPPKLLTGLPENIKQLTIMLQKAAEKGHASLVENLIQKGARPDVGEAKGNTPAHLAAQFGHKDALQVLLQKGVDVHATNSVGDRAINVACTWDHYTVVKLLHSFGADITGEGQAGWSPLHHAAANDNIEIMHYLLENGAGLETIATEGDTPLHSAISFDRYLATQELIKLGANIETPNFSLNRPLNVACKLGRLKIVQLLLDSGADINAQGCDGWTPLHSAAGNNEPETVEYLIERGANLGSLNDAGVTPLHTAAEKGYEGPVLSLINAGSNIEATHDGGNTPLVLAAVNGHCSAIKVLVSHGAKVDAGGAGGWRPIHEAAGNGLVEAMELLVNLGADIEGLTNAGFTPLQVAAKYNFGDAIKLLVSLGADPEARAPGDDRPIHFAIDPGNLQAVKTLIALGVSIEATNSLNFTPMFLAAGKGHIAIMSALIDAGVDVNFEGKHNGWTALHYTAANAKHKAMSFLLSKGAHLEPEAFNGDNPLHVAASHDFVDCVKVLLEAGADKTTIQNNGKTALDYAIEQSSEAAMQLLL